MDYISSAQIHKRVLMTHVLRHLERDWVADSGVYGSALAPVTFHEKVDMQYSLKLLLHSHGSYLQL